LTTIRSYLSDATPSRAVGDFEGRHSGCSVVGGDMRNRHHNPSSPAKDPRVRIQEKVTWAYFSVLGDPKVASARARIRTSPIVRGDVVGREQRAHKSGPAARNTRFCRGGENLTIRSRPEAVEFWIDQSGGDSAPGRRENLETPMRRRLSFRHSRRSRRAQRTRSPIFSRYGLLAIAFIGRWRLCGPWPAAIRVCTPSPTRSHLLSRSLAV